MYYSQRTQTRATELFPQNQTILNNGFYETNRCLGSNANAKQSQMLYTRNWVHTSGNSPQLHEASRFDEALTAMSGLRFEYVVIGKP